MVNRHKITEEIKHEKYDKNYWLYVQSESEEERYVLGERGKHPIICFGIIQ